LTEKIEFCLECKAGNIVNLKIGKAKKNLGAMIEVISTMSHEDPIANGIWPHMPTKFFIFLWRIKNQQLKTLLMLNAWGSNPNHLSPMWKRG